MSTPITHLGELNACESAVAWVKSTKCRSLEAAAAAYSAADAAAYSAADAYAPATYAATYSATKKKVLAECAKIVRKHYPELPT